MADLFEVFLLSMTPLGEMRISIPIGIAVYHLNWVLVFIVSVVGNMIPPILLLIFLKKMSGYLSEKSSTFRKAFGFWEKQTKERHLKKAQKYGAVGLALFIGVPLPFTGAYTGTLLAVLMNLSWQKSLAAIAGGVLIAGTIVTTVVLLGVNIEDFFGWPTLVGVIIFIAIIFVIWKLTTRKSNAFKK